MALVNDVSGRFCDSLFDAMGGLSDPKDKGLKRVLTRIRRVFKPKPWEK